MMRLSECVCEEAEIFEPLVCSGSAAEGPVGSPAPTPAG